MVQNILITLLLPVLALGAPTSVSAPAINSLSSRSAANPGGVFLKNNCGYDVTYAVMNPCGGSDSGTISAGSSWDGTLTSCSSGNTALKIYKDGSNKPMQFEYGLINGNVWYDMSFIDCVSGSDDFSQCAGAGWSMGCIGDCPTFSCSGGSECCTQGYCDPTASAVDPDPNAGCGEMQGYSVADLGVTMSICN